jgi:hypothetical protein
VPISNCGFPGMAAEEPGPGGSLILVGRGGGGGAATVVSDGGPIGSALIASGGGSSVGLGGIGGGAPSPEQFNSLSPGGALAAETSPLPETGAGGCGTHILDGVDYLYSVGRGGRSQGAGDGGGGGGNGSAPECQQPFPNETSAQLAWRLGQGLAGDGIFGGGGAHFYAQYALGGLAYGISGFGAGGDPGANGEDGYVRITF